MTAQGGDILAWLETAIKAREDAARDAHVTDPAPWTADTNAEATFGHAREAGSGLLVAASGQPLWDCEGASGLCMTAAASIHAALNDPKAVLRRCAADRKLIEAITSEPHFVSNDDEHFTCLAATIENDGGQHANWHRHPDADCDCGRDERVATFLGAIAEGYGWTGGER